jgi:hypothetical protein
MGPELVLGALCLVLLAWGDVHRRARHRLEDMFRQPGESRRQAVRREAREQARWRREIAARRAANGGEY